MKEALREYGRTVAIFAAAGLVLSLLVGLLAGNPFGVMLLRGILFAIAFFSAWGQSASGVSHVAHLGGMVVGWLYLKRFWRLADFWREIRWKWRRRRFRVETRDDRDPWIH